MFVTSDEQRATSSNQRQSDHRLHVRDLPAPDHFASFGDGKRSRLDILVLVNRGAAIGSEVMTLSRAIQESVYGRFGIRLEHEPVVV